MLIHIIIYHVLFNEAWIEAMLLSDPKDCRFYHGTCYTHQPWNMLQIFSLKLAKIPLDTGSVELYGYIATRDVLDPLLNYVVHFSRNDPLLIEQVHTHTYLLLLLFKIIVFISQYWEVMIIFIYRSNR